MEHPIGRCDAQAYSGELVKGGAGSWDGPAAESSSWVNVERISLGGVNENRELHFDQVNAFLPFRFFSLGSLVLSSPGGGSGQKWISDARAASEQSALRTKGLG